MENIHAKKHEKVEKAYKNEKLTILLIWLFYFVPSMFLQCSGSVTPLIFFQIFIFC